MLDFKIYPYCEIDGFHTFRDSEIKYLYHRMIDDNCNIYRDDSINNDNDFLNHMKFEAALYIVYTDGVPFGFVYLDHFEARTARIHFYIFKKFHGKNDNIELANEVLDTILSTKDSTGLFMYDVLIGLIPSDNKQGINFIKKLDSSTFVGEIPAAMWDKERQQSMNGTLIYFVRS